MAESLRALILTSSTYLFRIRFITSCKGLGFSNEKKFFPGWVSLNLYPINIPATTAILKRRGSQTWIFLFIQSLINTKINEIL
jgi:hypothetical protein